MAAIAWSQLAKFAIEDENISWPWQMALEGFRDVTYLRLEAKGTWRAAGDQFPPFPTDGLVGFPSPTDRVILQECPIGALIGKIGGSSASTVVPAAGASPSLSAGQIFAIGTHCQLVVPTGAIGPLYIGFNWLPRPLHVDKLELIISGSAPT